MSNDLVGAPGDLQPQVAVNFNLRASLARTMNQPVIVDDPAGLVVFGNTSAIYLAEVVSTGAAVYSRLPSIKANTYIHGWTVNAGKLYVLDGVELSAWDIGTGQKGQTLKLLKDPAAVAQANEALADLQKAIQRVEWATLLEQAEDEWLRLTAQQSAATPSSDERDRLDILAADYFVMLKALRELTGSTGGSAAARTLVKSLRQQLADKRKAVARWCFSPPVVRHRSFDQPLRAIFIVQGDGTLYACDKPVTQSDSKKWRQQAELTIALMEDLEMFAYVGDNVLRTVDAAGMTEKGSWTPETPPPAGANHTLTWSNKQLWWGTEAGVYACQADAAGILKPVLKSGPVWSTRQVGRLNAPPAPYTPAVNPNDLFEAMKITAWIAQRSNPAAPLSDGMTAQLMLSDENGKYSTPAEGISYVLHGPFAGDARSQASGWTQIKAHAGKPLVILSDSRGASVLCRYPTPGGISQLVPQWSMVPWLSSVVPHSTLDQELSRAWPTPAVKPVAKPFPDMVAHLKSSPLAAAAEYYERLLAMYGRKLSDRDLRLLLWYGLYNRPFPATFFWSSLDLVKDSTKLLNLFFNDSEQLLLKNRFGQPGAVWDLLPADNNSFLSKFNAKSTPVDFDPPWVWKTPPANLFHSAPPAWYDPWGYNRPADFFPGQVSGNYLAPFCFDGLLPFPQRPITLEGTFKGRSWAMFTDNDTASILANAKPATKETPDEDPVLLQAAGDPMTLVVTADEDRQRTVFQLLAPKPMHITFDGLNHTLRPAATEFGSTGVDIIAAPTVYKRQSKTFPTAWCVVNPEFSAARLRKLAATNPQTGVSPWSKFVDDNRAQYGPIGPGKTWQIEKCPLPATALPVIWLHGYNLPASS